MIAKSNDMVKTMVKPVEVSNPALDHRPTVIPICPMINAAMTICLGECDNKRAASAGMTSRAPINMEPTARKANTVNKARSNIKIRRCHFALMPSLTAISGSIAI